MSEIVLKTTNDPQRIKVTDAEAVILADDMDWLKELAGNIRRCSDGKIIREAEHDFHEEMTKRYGGKVSGEMLAMLWRMTS